MTPLDLDAIRKRLRKTCDYSELRDVEALISEVEALREQLQSSNALYTESLVEVKALCAKLEKAKGAASIAIGTAEFAYGPNGTSQNLVKAKEIMAELEEP